MRPPGEVNNGSLIKSGGTLEGDITAIDYPGLALRVGTARRLVFVLDGTYGGFGFVDGLSFFGLQRNSSNGHDSEMVELLRAGLKREGAGDWKVHLGGMWCSVEPPDYRSREQGWKLHLSATPSSATAVLERTLGVLVRHGCAFKVAKSLELVTLLNSRQYQRGGSGKFMTVYPDSDEQFCRLAQELDAATAGLSGPTILSDRSYRPGSLVHYRYGGFANPVVLSNDSSYLPMLRGPDGSLVEDRRDAWFNPPAWASSPLGEPDATEAKAGTSGPVLLADRFVVRQAIRHTNKGGVYRGLDTRTNAEVVIKEGRPYVEAFVIDGVESDVRDSLRYEAEMLDLLAPLGVAPYKIELFEQGGHVFLAEELIDGIALRDWVRLHIGHGPGLPWELAVNMIRRLAELLALVHGKGLVLRDLTPTNVMVTGDGEARIVDLELVIPPGTEAPPAGTAGYAAPEQLAGAVPTTAADLYSLGAFAFICATGIEPVFLEDQPEDQPAVRSKRAHLEYWLDITAVHSEAAKRLAPLILGLMNETPEDRWDLKRVQAFLDAQEQMLAPATALADGPEPDGRRLSPSDQQRVIEDGLRYLLASMTPTKDRLWPSSTWGPSTDPCNMHHGAAGVLAVLTQAAQRYEDDCLREALRTACVWIERWLPAEPRLLPGLNFGRSGTAWALYDAAQMLGDDAVAARALAFAKRVPIIWPNPDVTHGAAGAGLAQLYLWQATGDAEFRRRVERCADHLVAVAERQSTGVIWTVPASFDSGFAGASFYGFAHGVAGTAWFLLAAGTAMDRADYLELARTAGETLCATARCDESGAVWGEGPGDEAAGWVHWCHGSSGIGTFLIRLWQATGEERYRELAEMAAVAVYRRRWYASPVVCHGLAGNGEFLLDMGAALNEPRYQAWAEELAAIIFGRHAYHEGRIVIPDDTGIGLAVEYGVGLAGVIGFFLRLRYGGPRMWMAEPAPLVAVGATR